jgi:hypothetical protein
MQPSDHRTRDELLDRSLRLSKDEMLTSKVTPNEPSIEKK